MCLLSLVNSNWPPSTSVMCTSLCYSALLPTPQRPAPWDHFLPAQTQKDIDSICKPRITAIQKCNFVTVATYEFHPFQDFFRMPLKNLTLMSRLWGLWWVCPMRGGKPWWKTTVYIMRRPYASAVIASRVVTRSLLGSPGRGIESRDACHPGHSAFFIFHDGRFLMAFATSSDS